MIRSLMPLTLIFLAGCGADMKEFAPDASFSVSFPGTPQADTTVSTTGLTTKTFYVEERGGIFTLSVTDYPGGKQFDNEEVEGRLKSLRDVLLNHYGARMTGEQEIMLSGSPGRTLEADLTQREGKLRARFYLVKGRLYQLVAIGSAKWAKSDDVNKFLESLTVAP